MSPTLRGVALIWLATVALAVMLGGSVRGDEIDQQFQALLEKPDKANYLKVFESVTSHPGYNPYSEDLDEAFDLVDKKEFQAAQAKLQAAMPNLLLSPRAHNLAALVAKGLGKADEARHEEQIADKCLEAILSTGDGTSHVKAYLVVRPSDEYDILRNRKIAFSAQSLQKLEGRHYDVFRGKDGQNHWFDVTIPFEALSKRIREK